MKIIPGTLFGALTLAMASATPLVAANANPAPGKATDTRAGTTHIGDALASDRSVTDISARRYYRHYGYRYYRPYYRPRYYNPYGYYGYRPYGYYGGYYRRPGIYFSF